MSKTSKKYKANLAKIQEAKGDKQTLEIKEAVELLFSLEGPKYKEGPTVELHVKLNIDPNKSDQFIRSSVTLPHGTGKKVKIAAFTTPENEEIAKKAGADIVGGEDLIAKIKKTETADFDIALADTGTMKKLAPIAKTLGTKGLMPNPKTGTVGDNLEEMITTFKKGKVNYKNDKSANIHIGCGKINKDFDTTKITENIESALESIKKNKPESVKRKFILTAFLSTSQSPSIQII